MKVLGLILEINPFHNGHQYFIEEAIKQDQYDCVIAVISTSFCMRGDISVIDKFEKTKLLLQNKVDLVVELPIAYSINSSDYFCSYAIQILNQFQVTDICFGTEIENVQALVLLNGLLTSPSFNEVWKSYIDKGCSYSAASIQALRDFKIQEELIQEYSLPNNTLALGYIKAIKNTNLSVNIHSVQRIENNYYDTSATQSIASALSLRNELNEGHSIQSFIPKYEYDFVIPKDIEEKMYHLLQYEFITSPIEAIQRKCMVSEGIENRMNSFIQSPSYESFVSNVTTKRYNASRIKRTLLHILLKDEGIQSENLYLRILGWNEVGKKYFSKISKINKELKNQTLVNIKNQLDNQILCLELKASKFYDLLTNKATFQEEFKTPLLIEQIIMNKNEIKDEKENE